MRSGAGQTPSSSVTATENASANGRRRGDRRPVVLADGLAHVHRHHHPQVVVGGDHAHDHAHEGQHHPARGDRGVEQVELAHEAGGDRDAGERDEEHGERGGERRPPLGEARQVAAARAAPGRRARARRSRRRPRGSPRRRPRGRRAWPRRRARAPPRVRSAGSPRARSRSRPACASGSSGRAPRGCRRPWSTIASTATSGCQWEASAGSAESKTRRSAPKAAALTPADMKAVTVVGAPSYTSGAHMWKGTLATLKPKPTSSRAAPEHGEGDRLRATAPPPRAPPRSSEVLPLTP